MIPQFIVIAGKKQAGKTTAAKYIKSILENNHILDQKIRQAKQCKEVYERTGEMAFPGLTFTPSNLVKITSFASPIKDFCLNVLGLTEAQIYGSNEDKNSKTRYNWESMPKEILDANGIYRLYDMTAREVMQVFGTDIVRNFFNKDVWAGAPYAKYAKSKHKYVIIDDCRFPNEADMALKNGAILIRLTRNVDPAVHISEKALDDYPTENYHYVIDNHMYHNVACLQKDLENIFKA